MNLALTEILQPFVTTPLSADQLHDLQVYLDLLLKWNARMNLTAVRDAEQMARRHFGESLFAAEQLRLQTSSSLIDVGSGAGFPGLPIKVFAPHLDVVLIESQNRKATFLREVVRTLKLQNVWVHEGRAERLQRQSQIVTMRAVEKFDAMLPIAASLATPEGRLGLLIGAAQVQIARRLLPNFSWQEPLQIPESRERILAIGVSPP